MHKPESVLGNKTHKIIWDFKIQTDHLIPVLRPDVEIEDQRKNRGHKNQTLELEIRGKIETIKPDLGIRDHRINGDLNDQT